MMEYDQTLSGSTGKAAPAKAEAPAASLPVALPGPATSTDVFDLALWLRDLEQAVMDPANSGAAVQLLIGKSVLERAKARARLHAICTILAACGHALAKDGRF